MSKSKKKTVSRSRSHKHTKPTAPLQSGLTKIKVVGIGGGGTNAVSRMMQDPERIRGVEFIAVNTDAQDLDYANSHKKIYIGKALTHGLGAGMNPEIGKQAAEENRSEIGEMLDGADIVFVTAGMGGGTGSGASPVVAEVAREKGILTVAIVTKPFSFEGSQRMNIAQDALTRLKEKVDAMVVIPNDKIFSLIDKDTPVMKAFAHVDEVLRNAVKSIAELINNPGIINVDFADIETTLKDAGPTLIGIGAASGPDRAAKAAELAINSPLLEISIDGAKGVLFSIAGGKDLKMSEINEVAKTVASTLDPNARVIFGAYYDRSLKEKVIKVTVIASGFNSSFSGGRMGVPSLFVPETAMRKEALPDIQDKAEKDKKEVMGQPILIEKDKEKEKTVIVKPAPKEDSWEIPAFLRKKRK
jgi:cell division protein FtsZ